VAALEEAAVILAKAVVARVRAADSPGKAVATLEGAAVILAKAVAGQG
jgi:hypothetical protein